MIWRLKSTVRMPMATSTKKLEKPVTAISPSFLKSFCTGTRCSVHFLEKKCEHMTASEITAPVAVESPAPNTPRSSTNTQNQSPNTLKMPPVSTAAVASPGLASFRRKLVTSCPSRNTGNTQRTGARYACASGRSVSSAPKNSSTSRSKRRIQAHDSTARMPEPTTAAVKYWLSSPCA